MVKETRSAQHACEPAVDLVHHEPRQTSTGEVYEIPHLTARRAGWPVDFKQLAAPSGRWVDMEPDLAWFDLAPDHGVLELHERITAGVGLELHVVICSDGGGTIAWWEVDGGAWIWSVSAGSA